MWHNVNRHQVALCENLAQQDYLISAESISPLANKSDQRPIRLHIIKLAGVSARLKPAEDAY